MSKKKQKNKKKSKDKNRTGLSGHRRQGKTLNPPFLHHTPGMSFSSWKDDRMPEMLWAVLAVGRAERDYALAFFRYVLQYAHDNKIEDLTLTGISKLGDVQRDALIEHMCDYSSRIKSVLRPILLFNNLPARNDWAKYLPSANPEDDWSILAPCIVDVFDHQSQKATDCRWVKLMPAILTGKMKLNTKEAVENLLQYPNQGDMHAVRPYIRASEIAFPSEDKKWPDDFWKQGLEEGKGVRYLFTVAYCMFCYVPCYVKIITEKVPDPIFPEKVPDPIFLCDPIFLTPFFPFFRKWTIIQN